MLLSWLVMSDDDTEASNGTGGQRRPRRSLMSESKTTILIICDEKVVQPLLSVMDRHGIVAQSSKRRNLDGADVTSWVVVASIAIKFAPEILRAIADVLRSGRVQSIKYGNFVIEYPQPEDVEQIIDRLPLESQNDP
jgi:hypothetical protein